MDSLTGTTVYYATWASADWTWVWLLTPEGIAQLLIRSAVVEANDGLPPRTRISVWGSWRDRQVPKLREEDEDRFFVVERLEVEEGPPPPARMGL